MRASTPARLRRPVPPPRARDTRATSLRLLFVTDEGWQTARLPAAPTYGAPESMLTPAAWTRGSVVLATGSTPSSMCYQSQQNHLFCVLFFVTTGSDVCVALASRVRVCLSEVQPPLPPCNTEPQDGLRLNAVTHTHTLSLTHTLSPCIQHDILLLLTQARRTPYRARVLSLARTLSLALSFCAFFLALSCSRFSLARALAHSVASVP